MSRIPLSSPLLLVFLLCALAGCGRRGPLEPPPGSVVSPPQRSAATVDPGVQSNPTRPSLTRDTADPLTFNRENSLTPPPPPVAPRTPFFLDPLL